MSILVILQVKGDGWEFVTLLTRAQRQWSMTLVGFFAQHYSAYVELETS